jgi:hypothetical protein
VRYGNQNNRSKFLKWRKGYQSWYKEMDGSCKNGEDHEEKEAIVAMHLKETY